MFIDRFEELTVKQGATIKLSAKVIGNPVPEITWLRNNKPLKTSQKIKCSYDGENIELVILSADSEIDSGDYKCIASNVVGKASHGARVTIDVEKVVFTKILHKTYTSEENKSTSLECETSHTVVTKWYYNDKELSGMDHRVIAQNGRSHRLLIKVTQFRDDGKYKCTVKDQSTETELVVTEAKPDFIRKLQDFEANEKETAILEAEITSESADISWYKDGVQIIPDNNRIEYVKKGKIRQLIIRNVSVHDEGEYIGVLADQECSADLVVIELPPEIITKLENITIARGEKASFEIELTKGDALVTWLKDGEEIQFSDHVQLRIDGKTQKLKIYDSVIEDSGVYACIVGDQKQSAVLTVEQPLVEFIKKLPEITLVTKENDTTLTVELSQPNINLVWYRNSEIIKQSEKYTLIDEKTVKKLIIKNCQESDNHQYTCVACNVKSSTKLKVEIIKSAPSIALEDIERIYKVRNEEDVTVNIKFSATPKPEVEWFVSGTLVKPSKRLEIKSSDNTASLTIKKVVEEDAGSYTVKLRNSCGEAETSLQIIFMSKFT